MHRINALRLRRSTTLVLPKSLEPIGRQSRVSCCVLNVAVAEVSLQRAGIDAIVGELKACRMAQLADHR